MNLFKKGAFIFYGTVGVCRVNDISSMDFSGSDRLYYSLTPSFENDTTIYIPVDSDKVLMREIMTKQEAERFVLSWPDITCEPHANYKEQAKAHQQILKSGNCLELGAMIKEITRQSISGKRSGKSMSGNQRDVIKIAQKLLYGELSVALDIEPAKIPEYIEKRTEPCASV